MHARHFNGVALVLAASVAIAPAAFAGGGHGGGVFHPAGGFHGGFHGGFGGFRGGMGGWGRGGGSRGLPPVAGVIHEGPGMRPYYSAYGHTDTAARFGGFGRGGMPGYGHTGTALAFNGGFRPAAAGYGHLGTSLRYGAYGQAGRGAFGQGRRRFAAGRGFGGYGGYGGVGGGYGFGGGTYGAPGIYGDAGIYGGQNTYGSQGSYGGQGTYGGGGTTATQSLYGTGEGEAYRSERPLAARYAEAPLAPSPFSAYSPDDRYAYAASEDVGSGPRIVNVHRLSSSDCACGPRAAPTFYRYGIGTAY